ncbi:MAG: hypothetical protein EXR71_07485 [Myxococcales bacterium]|nr:hypothetical protein [Myxococcales bacterium]
MHRRIATLTLLGGAILACAGTDTADILDAAVTCDAGELGATTDTVRFAVETSGDIESVEAIVLDGDLELTRVDCYPDEENRCSGAVAVFALPLDSCEDATALQYRIHATTSAGTTVDYDIG